MRIRQQFVSNSSSTSYVIIGKKIEGSWEEAEKFTENNPTINCIYLDGEGYFVGKILHSISSDYYKKGKEYYNSQELIDTFTEVSQKLHLPIENLELFCGTVQS